MKHHINQPYKAIVIGATGPVGAQLVQKLLTTEQCTQVTVIAQQALPFKHAKLKAEIWHDFTVLQHQNSVAIKRVFKGYDVLFCCLSAPKNLLSLFKNKFGKVHETVDYYYVVGASSIENLASVPQLTLVSDPAANSKEPLLISKVKLHQHGVKQSNGFKGLSIFQPRHIQRGVDRSGWLLNRWCKYTLAYLWNLMPSKQQALKAEEVAKAMQVEFEMRLQGIISHTAHYQTEAMRALVTGSTAKFSHMA